MPIFKKRGGADECAAIAEPEANAANHDEQAADGTFDLGMWSDPHWARVRKDDTAKKASAPTPK